MFNKMTVGTLCLLVVSTLSFYASAQTSPPQHSKAVPANPAEEKSTRMLVNEKAKAARTGSEPEVRDLADQLLQAGGVDPEIASAFEVKERLIQAELRYKQGAHPALTEDKIAIAINGLAARMAFPEFAKTNKAEVRELRVRLLPMFPHLLGSTAPSDVNGKYEAVSQSLSPLEGFFVASTLIQQKFSNERFQITEEERTARLHSSGPAPQKPVVAPGSRSREMGLALNRVTEQMSLRDILDVSDEFITSLGIQSLGKDGRQ